MHDTFCSTDKMGNACGKWVISTEQIFATNNNNTTKQQTKDGVNDL